ncbi:MAG: carbohydrate ABC transporter permease [Candidatus Loosdrechtia sp.]|uniref:carbohydrate ABC transporter permease n=1 Tax=Candidatus Loosdrechtia sp. TaxID=3101272 RepID=UPI003A61202F|nr:MAG: sugar ABC transporter permease [Candidatus Jettenia sp. AMX2]
MNLQKNKLPYLFLLPGLLLVLAFSFIPFLTTVITSFQDEKLILPQERFTGIHNYQQILTNVHFWYSLAITIVYACVSIFFEAILGLCLGLTMNRLTPKSSFLRILILIPWTIPTVVTAKIWQWMFDYNLGIINYVLETLMIGRVNWLGEPFLALLSIVVADVWKTSPFVAIIVLAGLSAIPRDIYKAATVDGANSWQQFRFMTFPLLLPILGVAILFRAIDALRIFDLVYVLTGGGPGGATETLSVYAYKLFFYKGDFGQGAATSVIVLLLVAGFGYFYTKKSFA